MTTTPDAEPEGRPRMTMRVYRVSRDGAVSREVSRVEVMTGDKLAPIMTSRFPPCECPFHRDRGTGFERHRPK
jgi:hypothetical protein